MGNLTEQSIFEPFVDAVADSEDVTALVTNRPIQDLTNRTRYLWDHPLPPGFILPYAGASTPRGFLRCNGAAVSRTAYPELFAAIGTDYGIGDGSTTFNLPDVRGRFPRFLDEGVGLDPGRQRGTAQNDAIRNITGSIGNIEYAVDHLTGAFFKNAATDYGIRSPYAAYSPQVNFDASRVVPTADENRPVNTAFPAMISY